MAQLAGSRCAVCGGHIEGGLDSRFCPACRSPVHDECAAAAQAGAAAGACPRCGAPAAVVEAAARKEREQAEAERATHGMQSVAAGFGCIACGIVGTVLCSGLAGELRTNRLVIFAVAVGIGLIVRGLRQSRRPPGPAGDKE